MARKLGKYISVKLAMEGEVYGELLYKMNHEKGLDSDVTSYFMM